MSHDTSQTVAVDPTKGLPRRSLVPSRAGQFFSGRVLSMLLVFIVLCAFFHFASDEIFFQPRNLSLLLRQASLVAVVFSGGVDPDGHG